MGKRILTCGLSLLLLLGLVTGCSNGNTDAPETTMTTKATTTTTAETLKAREIPFTQGAAQRVVDSAIPKDCFTLFGQVVTSREQLDTMVISQAPLHDSEGGAKSALAEYTVSFFEEKALVVLYFRLTSGSHRVRTDRLVLENGVLTVDYTLLKPGVCTADMAEWYVLLEISRTDAAGIQTVVEGQKQTETTPSGVNG